MRARPSTGVQSDNSSKQVRSSFRNGKKWLVKAVLQGNAHAKEMLTDVLTDEARFESGRAPPTTADEDFYDEASYSDARDF
jgi:hypothetical protein